MKNDDYQRYLHQHKKKFFFGVHILLYLFCCIGIAVSLFSGKLNHTVRTVILAAGWGTGLALHAINIFPHIKKSSRTPPLDDEEVVAETIGRR